jgi:trans-aconitate methyltransferase
MYDPVRHWNDTYLAKADTQVSWFQETPSSSLALIEALAHGRDAPILDVGGGASRLADGLLARGYSDLSVLDVSEVALNHSRRRLGDRAGKVSWILADVTDWTPPRRWRIWHDRAMFHFLTEPRQQQAYVSALRRATQPGASVIIAGFAPDGPERCSGLPVRRHSAEDLARCLGEEFIISGQRREVHHTPFGTDQDFLYALFRRQS